jgi:hypothetical protein
MLSIETLLLDLHRRDALEIGATEHLIEMLDELLGGSIRELLDLGELLHISIFKHLQ